MNTITVTADFEFDDEGNVVAISHLAIRENGISTRFASWEEVEESYAINPIRLHFARVAFERAVATARQQQRDERQTRAELRRMGRG